MAEPRVMIFSTVAELQRAAAQQVARVLAPTTTGRDIHIALSGGSTPRRMHELLAKSTGIDWNHVHVYFGDERTVSPHDEQSNYRMARETLLSRVPIPAENVHRMRGEDPPGVAAEEYAGVLRETFQLRPAGLPRFDLIILGVGSDGHTASLFPGTAALLESTRLVVANVVPQLDAWRITLTYPVLNAARQVLFLAAGADKAEAIRRIFDPSEADKPPAAFVSPAGDTFWMLDEAAAAGLPAAVRQD